MSSFLRASVGYSTTLRYASPKLSPFGSNFVRAGIFRCFSANALPEVDLMAVRSNAIAELATHINYVEKSGSVAPVIESMIRHLMDKHAIKKKIPKSFVNTLLDASIAMHTAMPNIIPVERLLVEASEQDPSSEEIAVEYGSRLSVLGDLHGYYDDLAMLFKESELGDMPSPYNQYIFNGDLVDRGPMSVEVMVTVLFCNLLLPNAVHILRGNHETKFCNKQFGFMTEVLRKYDVDTLNKFHALFDALPVGAVIEGEYFVVHGGLGTVTGDSTIEELNKVDRFCEPKQASVVAELLWSDPLDGMTGHDKNKVRGGEVTAWGPDISEAFLTRNNLQAIIRSHEFMEEGFSMCHDGLVWTVFSAPNYEHGANLGALVRFQGLHDNMPTIIQYSSAAMKRIADAEKEAKEKSKSADA